MLVKTAEFGDLPFVSGGSDWVPTRSGDYANDCDTGRYYARELLALIRVTENPLYYSRVARAITAGGVFGAVETGFCSVVGINLIGG